MTWAYPILLVATIGQTPTNDSGLLHQWRLTTDKINGQSLKADAGPLDGVIAGPVDFGADNPKALRFTGNHKAKHGIEITKDIKAAGLPDKAISVEAWVRVDEPHVWGGVAGAFQHNGPYQKGWVLGFNHSNFSFAVAGKNGKTLTYLKDKNVLQTGFWYHLVGTYDGKEQKLFVNGKLAGLSRAQSGPIDYPPRAVYGLGVYRDDDEHFVLKGELERVSVFSTVLTAEQVTRRFSQRKAQFPDMDAVPPKVADWPTYLRDNLRTGATPENVRLPLHLKWIHQARFAPMPAWPQEAKHDYWHEKHNLEDIVTFDRGFHLVSIGDSVYFGSSADDRVYCLDANNGKTRWSFCTEGPVRLAPTIADGKVLFGSDDGHVYCVKSDDGSLVWKTLVGPSARRLPGNQRIISLWPVRTDVMVEGNKAYACAGVFPSQGVYQAVLDMTTGKILEKKSIDVTAQGYMQRRNGQLKVATGRNTAGAFVGRLERMGREIDRDTTALPKEYPHAFIAAGSLRFAGGDGKIAAFRAVDGARVWDAKVEGKAYSLIAVRGRLFASTDKGYIYCFDPGAGEHHVVAPPRPRSPVVGDVAADSYRRLTGRWARESPKRGYALVLGSGDGRLAYELASRCELHVIGVEPDAKKVEASRRLLDAGGLADRVIIHHGSLDVLPYTDYLFNLIVGESLVADGKLPGKREEILRVLRPHGGLAIFGPQEQDWVRAGALDGEGEWTHQYADAGNTACSGDTRIGSELQMQWFGKPGPREMIDRHHRTAAPLYKEGRLFVPGEDRVVAVDAYNGTILWDKEFPGSRRVIVFRDSSYLAHGNKHLYLAMPDHCLALDPDSGETLQTLALPGAAAKKKMDWGFLATSGDIVVGSATKPGSSRRSQSLIIDRTETYYDYVPVVGSDLLFAHDAKTGKERWTYEPGGLIVNPAIALAQDTVFFIESANPETLKGQKSRARLAELLGKGSTVVALDLETGKERWRKPLELTALDHIVYLCYAKDRLVVSGSRNSAKDKKIGKVHYDLYVLSAKTGETIWSKSQNTNLAIGGDHGEQDQHPVIVDTKLYQEPFAYDVSSGDAIAWKWPWATGKRRPGCGSISASASTFFFRSETAGMFDLLTDQPKRLTTETRPGCWINLIPAGGLVLAPEASSGCTCGFSVQTSLALIPVRRAK